MERNADLSSRASLSPLELGSVRLACSDRGLGAPVVLVHGSNSDVRTWAPVTDQLGERYRVVAYSRRYHWPNEPIAVGADYAMSEHVDDLERLVDASHLAPAHLVGHSYGALVCLLLAMRRPDVARSLVLVEPPALTLFTSSTPRPHELLRLALSRPRTALAIVRFGAQGVVPARRALERGDPDAALDHMARAVLGRDAYRQLPLQRREMARCNFIAAELLGSGFAALPDEQVRRVRIPTLLMTGACSPPLFHRLTDRLRELMPTTTRATIAHASHIVHEDNPVAWLAAVLAFLARHAPQPADAARRAGLAPGALARMHR